MLWIDIHKAGLVETVSQGEGHGAVKERLTGNSVVADAGGVIRVVGRIQRMGADAGNGDDVHISLEPGVHGPEYVVDIEAVHVFVHEEDGLQFAESGESEKRSLALTSFIAGDSLFELQHGHEFAAAGRGAGSFVSTGGMG